MRYAIISDIHGNLPALDAVLADAEKSGADSYIFAGDIMSDLPWVNEAVERIRRLPRVYAVAGNRDERALRCGREAEALRGVDQMAALYNTQRILTTETFEYLSSLPKELYVPLPYHGMAYVTHWVDDMLDDSSVFRYSSTFRTAMEKRPFTHGEFLEQTASAAREESVRERVRRALAGIDAEAVIFGHNHLQWHGWFDGRLLIDAGSCGLPCDFDARAPYTILEVTASGLIAEDRRVAYDVEETMRRAEASGIYAGSGADVWRDLVFKCLRESKDVFKEFFAVAWQIAQERGESDDPGDFYSNVAWREAGDRYFLEP